MVLGYQVFNDRILFTCATSCRVLICSLFRFNFNDVLVENSPLSLNFVDVLVLLFLIVLEINVAAIVHFYLEVLTIIRGGLSPLEV